jgi:large subunit ribosomal protein L6
MSRIGKLPISIPQNINIAIDKDVVVVSNSQNQSLSLNIPQKIKVEVKENQIIVTRLSEDKQTKSNHGTIRARLNNMLQGLVTPFKKEMEIRGTGYKFIVNGDKLTVSAGYIHPVVITALEGIKFESPDESKLIISGADKITVGQTASNIRKIRKPEPYKGKGIRYANEVIKLKAGKTAKA